MCAMCRAPDSMRFSWVRWSVGRSLRLSGRHVPSTPPEYLDVISSKVRVLTPQLRREARRATMDATEPFDQFSLSVQREEVESVKAGAAVYVRKSKLFFLSSKQEALDHIERAGAQPAATPTATDLPERAA